MRVELRIERLVLDGLSQPEAERIAQGVARGLETRLAEAPLSPHLDAPGRTVHVPRLDAGRLPPGGETTADTTGAALAAALRGALER